MAGAAPSILALIGGVPAGDAAKGGCSTHAMLTEPTRRIPARIEPRNDPAAKVNDLSTGVDADARIAVVQRGRVPGRVEWRRGNLVHRSGFLEVAIDPGINEGIVPLDRAAQRRAGHRPPLVLIDDLGGQLLRRIGA